MLGGGDHLVAEADESDGSFLHLVPTIAVVTNIDLEHVDHYPDLAAVRAAFLEFLPAAGQFYGTAVLCHDDPAVCGAGRQPRPSRGHLRPDPRGGGPCRRGELHDRPTGQSADVWAGEHRLGRSQFPARRHNLRNALAAVAVARASWGGVRVAAAALAGFAGALAAAARTTGSIAASS
ncbi:MAG: Mur ligase family protein [Candidatus Krumholzibacteriia bacterium]